MVAPPANETTIRQVSVRPDSLEIGTPGKNGALKIYMDFSDPADCEQRIRTAVAMRELANQLITAPMEMVRAWLRKRGKELPIF
jgi:hypothetical protein